MASGKCKGYFSISQNWFDGGSAQYAKSAYVRLGSGIEGQLEADVSSVYIWETPTSKTIQFDILVSDSNVTQGNWNLLSVGGSCGVAAGILLLKLGAQGLGTTYLFSPDRGFGYYNASSNKLTVFLTATSVRVN